MTTFPVHTVESAPDGSAEALKGIESRVGFVPNLAATMAGSPVLVTAFGDMQPTLGRSTLTGLEREVVALTLSHANTADYPLAAHGRFAVMQGGSPELVDALCAGGTLTDARLDASLAGGSSESSLTTTFDVYDVGENIEVEVPDPADVIAT